VTELAFQIPLLMLLLFGAVQLGRVFYMYHTLQKALRGGAGLLARSVNVSYCPEDTRLADPRIVDSLNFIVYGNLQGIGNPVVAGLTTDMIQVLPERNTSGSLSSCVCSGPGDSDSCDTTVGGRAPDFVVVNLGDGFPLPVPFPFMNLSTITLKVSVRMPVTGG
jgi:Flp pilus assembly protein TadG